MAIWMTTRTGIVHRYPNLDSEVRNDIKKGAAVANAKSIWTSLELARDSPRVLAVPDGTTFTTWCFSMFDCWVRLAAFSTAMQTAATTSHVEE